MSFFISGLPSHDKADALDNTNFSNPIANGLTELESGSVYARQAEKIRLRSNTSTQSSDTIKSDVPAGADTPKSRRFI